MKQLIKILIIFTLIITTLNQTVYAEVFVAGFDISKLSKVEFEELIVLKMKNIDTKREQILKEDGLDNRFTENEIEILERITEAEAEGEGLIGKILVVNVIINRLNDDRFDDHIKEIVFAKDQFQPIRDGRYNKIKVTKETKNAVSLVVDCGFLISDKILFFHSSKSKGFSNLNKLFTYGGHTFY